SVALPCSPCKDKALRCYTCVADGEDECNRQGSSTCPKYADACATVMGLNTLVKSCSYKSFCDKAHHGGEDVRMECCFTDDCNGPHLSHSHRGGHSATGVLSSSPALVLGALLLLHLAFGKP
ncbi:lymphocyte antigen 6D-like, partial [Scleropages formosus]